MLHLQLWVAISLLSPLAAPLGGPAAEDPTARATAERPGPWPRATNPADAFPDLRDPARAALRWGTRAAAPALPVRAPALDPSPQPPALRLALGEAPHPPVVIVGDAGFRAAGSGVVAGNGTADDPFVIAGWSFLAADGRGPSLALRDTTAHVRIERNRVGDAVPAPGRFAAQNATNHTWENPYAFRDRWHDEPQEFSIWIENASNVVVRGNEGKAAFLACRGCVVEGNRLRHVRADGVVDVAFSGNELITLFVDSGSGVRVSGNVVYAWERWAFPFRFLQGSVAEADGNVVRGIWQNGFVVDCDGGPLRLAGNDVDLANPYAKDDAVRATDCASATVEANRFVGGTLRFEDVDDVRLSGNELLAASANVRTHREFVASGNRVEGGTFTVTGGDAATITGNRFAAGGGRTLLARDVALATLRGNTFEDLTVEVRGSAGTVEENAFTGGGLLLRDARPVVVAENAFTQGRGLEAVGAEGLLVLGNSFSGTDLGAYVEDAAGARVTGNAVTGAAIAFEAVDSPGVAITGNVVGDSAGGLAALRSPGASLVGNRLERVPGAALVWGDTREDYLVDVSGTSADGRPFVALEKCDAAAAAAAAARAAFLVLVDCAPLVLDGIAPPAGIASFGTGLDVRDVEWRGALAALAVAAAPSVTLRDARVDGGIALLASGVGSAGVSRSVLDGAIVAVNGTASARFAGNVVRSGSFVAYGSGEVVVERNDFAGTPLAVGIREAREARVAHNRVAGCELAIALVLSPGAVAAGNEIAACAGGVGANAGAVVLDNVLSARPASDGYGIGVFGAGEPVEVRGNVALGFNRGLHVENDYAAAVTGAIAANVFADGTYGVLTLGSTGLAFSGNLLGWNSWGHVARCDRDMALSCRDRLEGNRFVANRRVGLELEFTLPAALSGNDFEGNGIGLEWILPANLLLTPAACTGAGNWWGAPDGPSDPFAPLSGSGDAARCWSNYYLVEVKRPAIQGAWLAAPASGVGTGALALDVSASNRAPSPGEVVRLAATGAPEGFEHFFAPGDGAHREFTADATGEHAYAEEGAFGAWVVARAGPGAALAFARVGIEVR